MRCLFCGEAMRLETRASRKVYVCDRHLSATEGQSVPAHDVAELVEFVPNSDGSVRVEPKRR